MLRHVYLLTGNFIVKLLKKYPIEFVKRILRKHIGAVSSAGRAVDS